MAIELDSTLAQAEVLFLSFAQLVADIDRRQAEESSSSLQGLRHRGTDVAGELSSSSPKIVLSEYLRDLLKAGRT